MRREESGRINNKVQGEERKVGRGWSAEKRRACTIPTQIRCEGTERKEKKSMCVYVICCTICLAHCT